VDVEVSKSVLKLASVQHLYGRMAAALPVTPGVGARGADAALLGALHPTPAVCGRPQGAARAWLAAREGFDRGFYAGPFGWVTGQGAEFVVAIRSALLPAEAGGAAGGAQQVGARRPGPSGRA
jgi:isochorismate synthase EntC